jgi:hypothetical protein
MRNRPGVGLEYVDLTQDTVDPNVPTLPFPMPPAQTHGIKMETSDELAADARIKKEAKVDARIKKEAEETAAATPAPAAATGIVPAATPMFQFGSVSQLDASGVQHPIDTMGSTPYRHDDWGSKPS